MANEDENAKCMSMLLFTALSFFNNNNEHFVFYLKSKYFKIYQNENAFAL